MGRIAHPLTRDAIIQAKRVAAKYDTALTRLSVTAQQYEQLREDLRLCTGQALPQNGDQTTPVIVAGVRVIVEGSPHHEQTNQAADRRPRPG